MAEKPTTLLFIADLHLGDTRGTPALALGKLASIVNRLGPDVVINLNDTVAPEKRLVTSVARSPAEQYLSLWRDYGREFRTRVRAPVFDVGTPRDLPIWDQVAENPPHGTTVVGDTRLLWLCPERGSTALPADQRAWALDEIASHPDATWVIASHVPTRGSTPWDHREFLQDSEALKDAVNRHAARGIFVGGHFHLSHSAPLQEDRCLCMIGGGMNQMKSGGCSYAKRVTVLPGSVRVDEWHLNTDAIEATWEFDI